MKLFKMKLPGGWYPIEENECRAEIMKMTAPFQAKHTQSRGGLVPHAGWDFSGKIAAKVFATLAHNCPKPDRICIIGGHLATYHPVLFVDYDEAQTPLGNIKIDRDLTHRILAPIEEKVDDPNEGDNTVEILLPFVQYFFPGIPMISFRAPVSSRAETLGQRIAEITREEKLNCLVISSADLTHYGPNYSFLPHGVGEEALKWVKEVNDRELIDLIIAGKTGEAILHSREKRSSCSGGAIGTVMSYSVERGNYDAALVEYGTSYEVYHSNSFVGYAGIVF